MGFSESEIVRDKPRCDFPSPVHSSSSKRVDVSYRLDTLEQVTGAGIRLDSVEQDTGVGIRVDTVDQGTGVGMLPAWLVELGIKLNSCISSHCLSHCYFPT